MKFAVVIDGTIEFPQKMFQKNNVYPVGYVIEDSKGNRYQERTQVQKIQSKTLISIAEKDKKAQLYAPTIKDFVELYTFLAEDYDSLISIHSSLITPTVFDNALVAKKMVSEVNIDVIDTQTFGASSGLYLDELVKFIPNAKNISNIRKEAINLNKHINSYLITKNNQLVSEGQNKISWNKGLFTSSFKNYSLYHYFHTNWNLITSERNPRNLFKEIKDRVAIARKTKEIRAAYYSSSDEFKRDVSRTLSEFKKISKTETTSSITSYYFIGKDYASIAFI